MANLKVKSIDDDLYESLGRRAAMEYRSVSQEVVSILKAYLSIPGSQNQKVGQQFLELCGTCEDDESAESLAKMVRDSRAEPGQHRKVQI